MKKVYSALTGILILGLFVILVLKQKQPAEQSELSNAVAAQQNIPNQNRTDSSDAPELAAGSLEADYLPANLTEPVKILLGLDGVTQSYPTLLLAVNDLSYELSADDVAGLREMLNFSNDQFPEGMRPIEINAVKNDVLDKLLRQQDLSHGLGLQMVEMAGNADNDPVWRDYCVQFMQPYYEKASERELHVDGQGRSTDQEDELSAIREAMLNALDERDSTIAGTSLIGLELLSRTHEEFDRETITTKASEIAADESASPSSRLTALQLSALTGASESTANTTRALAQTGETALLRSAAIVTLGNVGSDEDRELLESYALANNKQIAGAAKMALQKMDAR